jgi:hypothetical protein
MKNVYIFYFLCYLIFNQLIISNNINNNQINIKEIIEPPFNQDKIFDNNELYFLTKYILIKKYFRQYIIIISFCLFNFVFMVCLIWIFMIHGSSDTKIKTILISILFISFVHYLSKRYINTIDTDFSFYDSSDSDIITINNNNILNKNLQKITTKIKYYNNQYVIFQKDSYLNENQLKQYNYLKFNIFFTKNQFFSIKKKFVYLNLISFFMLIIIVFIIHNYKYHDDSQFITNEYKVIILIIVLFLLCFTLVLQDYFPFFSMGYLDRVRQSINDRFFVDIMKFLMKNKHIALQLINNPSSINYLKIHYIKNLNKKHYYISIDPFNFFNSQSIDLKK